MTFLTEEYAVEREIPVFDEPVMALVDEFGSETPITELDIRRTLKELAEEPVVEKHSIKEDYDSLMLLADAARVIA